MREPVCAICGKAIEPARVALDLTHCEGCAALVQGNPLHKTNWVFVSGCYDIIHGGHIQFLTDARALGSRLIVCVPTDEVFINHKRRRPVLPLDHKLSVLRALRMVDEVVVGSDSQIGFNFVSAFHAQLRAAQQERCGLVLASTEDDAHFEAKTKFCKALGASYVQLPKRLAYLPTSSSELTKRLAAV